MSSDPATDSTRSKRLRINATARPFSTSETEQAPSQQKAPKALAVAFVKSHAASLQPQVASILERLGTNHINLLSKRYQKEVQIIKMETNKDFIPRSARIDFQFHMTKQAVSTPEFQLLKTQTETEINKFRTFLKKQVITAIKIKQSVLTNQIQDDFCQSLEHIVHTFLTANSISINSTNIKSTMDLVLNDTTLFKHCNLTKLTFLQRSLKSNTTSPDPEPMDHSDSLVLQGIIPYPTLDAHTTEPALSQDSDNHPNSPDPKIMNVSQSIRQAFKSVFVSAWDQYLDQVKKNQIAQQLAKLNVTVFDGPATEEAANIIAKEPSADRATLDALITEKTKAETKKLSLQIQQLTSKINTLTKNGHMRSQGHSSSPKQSVNRTTRTNLATNIEPIKLPEPINVPLPKTIATVEYSIPIQSPRDTTIAAPFVATDLNHQTKTTVAIVTTDHLHHPPAEGPPLNPAHANKETQPTKPTTFP